MPESVIATLYLPVSYTLLRQIRCRLMGTGMAIRWRGLIVLTVECVLLLLLVLAVSVGVSHGRRRGRSAGQPIAVSGPVTTRGLNDCGRRTCPWPGDQT